MGTTSNPLDQYLSRDIIIASERFPYHQAHPEISYDAYCKSLSDALHERIKSKRIIYLDTNAWKCLSDYARKKTSLTKEMQDFGEAMDDERVRNNCIFPLGITTLFELQSMDDPISLSTLAELVDKFSAGIACRPPDKIVDQELAMLNQKVTRDANAEPRRFCHPMEIVGSIAFKFPDILPAEEALAFAKTQLDVVLALPTSAHLAMAVGSPHRWDNSEGIDEMNEGMAAHKHEIKTYADALFVELSGMMKAHVPDGSPINGLSPQKHQAGVAMLSWNDNPNTRHLITARIQANIHATIRFIETRKFQKGDVADIFTASIALPSSHAFFTDRRLVTLLNEPKIGLKQFCSCEVISGFDNFAKYLKAI